MAHARITRIDTAAAAGAPGVVAVYTAADLGLQPVPAASTPLAALHVAGQRRHPLRRRTTGGHRHRAQGPGRGRRRARRGRLRAPRGTPRCRGSRASSTHLYPAAGSNVVFDSTALGMPGLTDESFFEGCDVVVKERLVNQRLAPCPLEVRGSAATWVDGRLYQWVSTQHAGRPGGAGRRQRGGERGRAGHHPGRGGRVRRQDRHVLRGAALGRIAKELGRPVIWRETRSESMVALGHGRAQVQHITLGGTRDGNVLAYRLRAFQDCGVRGDRHGARDLHDAAHVLGRLRHPEDRVPHVVRGHEHHAHCRLPRAGRLDRPPSSGPWTSSRPRSAWTRSTCDGRT